MIEDVRKELFKLQDLKYQKFHSGLCPNTSNIIGVRLPDIRLLVKKLLKEDYISYLNSVTNEYYEETMIEGLIIVTSKMPLGNKLSYLKSFIPKIDNWAVCDTICSSFKVKEKDLSIIWKFITEYKNSKKEFELRFMIVMMMNYYLVDEYFDEVIKIIDKIEVDYYYTNMAIAWLISFAYIKNKDGTLAYLRHNNLSQFTYQKALQKIIESNRVSKQEKEFIRALKK